MINLVARSIIEGCKTTWVAGVSEVVPLARSVVCCRFSLDITPC